MTKESYMALADFQALWNQIKNEKPIINKTVASTATCESIIDELT